MPHAEIHEVWPRDGRITIRGEIVSGRADASWTLRLMSRERKRSSKLRALGRVRALLGSSPRSPGEFTVPVTLEGTSFEAVLPLEPLAQAQPLPRELWDLHLVAPGERALRLGRHLDDMPGKKHIVTFPQQTVDAPSRISIRPYYTDGDHLSIRCLPRDKE